MTAAAIYQRPDYSLEWGAGIWPHRPSHWRPAHHHVEPEFNLVLAGEARFRLGHRVLELRPRALVWILPGVSHELVEASPDFQMWVVAFEPEYLAHALALAKSPSLQAGLVQLPESDLRVIGTVLRHLQDRQLSHQSFRERTIETVASALTSTLGSSRLQARTSSEITSCVVHETHCLAPGTPGTKLSIETLIWSVACQPEAQEPVLAALWGVRPEVLSRLCRSELGISWVELRRRVRLGQFLKSLSRGSHALRAAFEAGYGSYAQVHRDFVREFKSPPSLFRAPEQRERENLVRK